MLGLELSHMMGWSSSIDLELSKNWLDIFCTYMDLLQIDINIFPRGPPMGSMKTLKNTLSKNLVYVMPELNITLHQPTI